MEEWKKTQLDHVLRTLRATDTKLFVMLEKGIPDIGDIHIMHFAVEACITRLERVRGDDPINEAKLRKGE
jgi:hypothetical protein